MKRMRSLSCPSRSALANEATMSARVSSRARRSVAWHRWQRRWLHLDRCALAEARERRDQQALAYELGIDRPSLTTLRGKVRLVAGAWAAPPRPSRQLHEPRRM